MRRLGASSEHTFDPLGLASQQQAACLGFGHSGLCVLCWLPAYTSQPSDLAGGVLPSVVTQGGGEQARLSPLLPYFSVWLLEDH